MSPWRHALPQLSGRPFLADGGLETTLVFHERLALPHFAAFHALREPRGEAALRRYFRAYAAIAARHRTGVVLESATWRASADWGARLGYDARALAAANRHAVELLLDVRDEWESADTPVVASGCVGPRGDGYVAGEVMTAAESARYHRPQIDALADAGADMIAATTMTSAAEAVGIVRAAREAGLPVAVSFTVETDGRLPTGQPLAEAIAVVDAVTDGAASYFMVNCAHPTHLAPALAAEGPWMARVRGLRANASRRSHAELDDAPDLDEGDPDALGAEYAAMLRHLPRLNVLGGCCGTDHRHVERIAAACVPLFGAPAAASAQPASGVPVAGRNRSTTRRNSSTSSGFVR